MSERCTWLKRLALLSGLAAASIVMDQQPLMAQGYPAAGYPVDGYVSRVPGDAAIPAPETSNFGKPGAGPIRQTSGGLLSQLGGGGSGFHDAACGCEPTCEAGCCEPGCDVGGYCGDGCCGGGVCAGCGAAAGCGCPTCSGMLSKFCVFCRGEGCYLCRGMVLGMPTQLLDCIKPYDAGGIAAQRWYDISVEGTVLQRHAGTSTPLLINRPGGNVLFQTGDLDTSEAQGGLRASIACMFGVSGNLEGTFTGLNEWSDSQTIAVVPPGPLSVFSIDTLGGPVNLAEFDQATAYGISEMSQFNSGELNYRRRWVGPYGRFQGSWLAGVRYIDIDEQFDFFTVGPTSFSSVTNTRNSATGSQIGGDLWWNIIPGINLGIEGKGGLLANVAEQDTVLRSVTGGVVNAGFPLVEQADDTRTATLCEFSAQLVYRLSYSWTLRGSYIYMEIDDVALGRTNFNSTLNTANPNAGLLNAFAGRPCEPLREIDIVSKVGPSVQNTSGSLKIASASEV